MKESDSEKLICLWKFTRTNLLVSTCIHFTDEVEDKEAKAVVLEASTNEPTSKAAADKTQTRLFTSDPTLNSAIAGVGIGVVGSLLVGALLDAKKNKPCHPVYRRDTASTRFVHPLMCQICGKI